MERSARVLFVDDEERVGELVVSRVNAEREDLTVALETDPTVVVDRIASNDVDCVVSDYRMPEMDGIELLEAVRDRWPDLPFILFTGAGTEAVASEAISAGATDYFRKELDAEAYTLLANRIANAVEAYRTQVDNERIRERYSALLAQSRGLITVVGEDGRVQYQSPSVERVLGHDRSAVEGEFVEELIHEDDRARVAEVRTMLDEGERRVESFEFRARHSDGEWRWLEAVGTDRTDTVVDGYVYNAIEVTERKRREAELERKTRAMDEASIGITISDPDRPDNPMVYANDGFAALTGYDVEEVLGRNCRFLQGERTDDETVARIREAIDAGEQCTVELRNYRADGTEFWNRLKISPITDDDGTVTNFVGFQQDVSERKRYERTLTALHDVSRDLLTTETDGEIADIVTDAANELLDVDAAAVFLHDGDRNVLAPAAHTADTPDVVDEVPTFGAGEGIAWTVFVEGESRVYDDVGRSDDAYNPDTPIGSELLVPMGDHGVFVCGTTTADAFDASLLELADILAATGEAALDRSERERRLRERDEELDRRNDRLRKINEINERIRTICHEIVGANSRTAVYETVCSTLTDVGKFEFVWIGEPDSAGNEVVPRERAGMETGYLDAVDLGLDGDEPAARAVRNGETAVVDETADGLRASQWRQEALTRDYRSVVSLPLVDEGIQYGALTIYAGDADAFDDETETVLRSLTRTIATAVGTVDRRQAGTGDRRVELSFSLFGTGSPLLALGEGVDGRVQIDGVVTGSDTPVAYGSTVGDAESALRATAEDSHGIETVRILRSSDETTTFEVGLVDAPTIDAVLDHGGAFEELVVEDRSARLDVSFPASADVNAFVRLFCDRFPGAELRARRERRDEDHVAAGDDLTGRQREALATAYYSGYYEWPRVATSEEVAGSLDITKPTFLEHLRRAESTVVDRYLDNSPDP